MLEIRDCAAHNAISARAVSRAVQTRDERFVKPNFLAVSIRAGDVKKVKFLRGVLENANVGWSLRRKYREGPNGGERARAKRETGVASVPGGTNGETSSKSLLPGES